MKYILTLITVVSLLIGFSQNNIEHLKKAYSLADSDTKKLILLKKLNLLLVQFESPTKSISYFRDMKNIAERLRDTSSWSVAHRFLCESYMNLGYLDSAIQVMEQSMNVNRYNTSEYILDANQLGRAYHHFLRDSLAISIYQLGIEQYLSKPAGSQICQLISNMSISYSSLGLYDKNIEFSLIALKCVDCFGNDKEVNRMYYNLGWAYLELEQYEKAESYFLKSLNNQKHEDLSDYYYRNHHALGITYSRWGKFEQAYKHNILALEFYKNTGNRLYEFDVLNNLATLFINNKKYTEGLIYGFDALLIAQELSHPLALIGAHLTLIEGYIGLKDFKNAKIHLTWLLNQESLFENLSPREHVQFYQAVQITEAGLGNFQSALQYSLKYSSLNDSLLTAQRESRYFELENQYQAEKRERKNIELELEIEKKELKNIQLKNRVILSGIAIFFLVGLAFRFKYISNKTRKKYDFEVLKVKTLRDELKKKNSEFNSEKSFAEKEALFHHELKKRYTLTEANFEFWFLQIQGYREKEMEKLLFLSKDGVNSRRKALYIKLKSIEDIDLIEPFTNSDSVKLYRKNHKIFFK